MKNIQRIFEIAMIGALLSACAANTGLWGAPATPTPVDDTPTISSLPTQTAEAVPESTATLPPLIVLPASDSPTPGGAGATEPVPTLPPVNTAGPMDVYRSQGGDTLNIIATRFGVEPWQIVAETVLPLADDLIPSNTLMLMP